MRWAVVLVGMIILAATIGLAIYLWAASGFAI